MNGDQAIPGVFKQPEPASNAIGDWLERDATKSDKKNFFAFMNMLNSFEQKLAKKMKQSKVSKQVENGEVVMPLGKKLKVAMRFVSS